MTSFPKCYPGVDRGMGSVLSILDYLRLFQHLQEQTPAEGRRAVSSGDSQRTHLWSGSPIIYSAFISLLN